MDTNRSHQPVRGTVVPHGRDLAPRNPLVDTAPGLRISVVIPARNEAENLPSVLERLPRGLHEVILVDGDSTDDTVAVARALRPGIRVIGQTRAGKGNALACGIAASTGDIIVMMDADGSTDPVEIPLFVGALLAGADFVKGSRFAVGGGTTDMTLIRRAGNRGLNALVNLLYHTHYTDLCYGYNAVWRDKAKELDIDADGFEVETLMNIRAAKAGMRISEVPSFERDRLHGESNLDARRDGWRVLRTILRERFHHVGHPVERLERPAPAALPPDRAVEAR